VRSRSSGPGTVRLAPWPYGRRPIDTTITIEGEYIDLAALLKLASLVGSGGEAKLLIQDGHVMVDGAIETRRRAKIRPGSVVVLQVDPPVRLAVTAAAP
jgi:ribosome-associated protein